MNHHLRVGFAGGFAAFLIPVVFSRNPHIRFFDNPNKGLWIMWGVMYGSMIGTNIACFPPSLVLHFPVYCIYAKCAAGKN